MVELGRAGYLKQAVIYLSNQDYASAYSLCREFAGKFPDDMMAHFLFSKAAFWAADYRESASAARKAFNLAKTPEDMLPCAVLASTAYHELGEYLKGYEILKAMERIKSSEEVEKLLFIFSVDLREGREALSHMDELRRLNRKAAEEFMMKVISQF